MANLAETPIFFIFGRPRSGTTLLTTLFNAHPNVKIAPEFPIMLFLYQRFKHVKNWDEATIRSFVDHAYYTSKFNYRTLESLKIDKEALVNELLKYKGPGSVGTFLKSINYFSFSIFDKEEIQWIGDKNPIYSINAHRFRKIFPEAKFICIVRDYRDNFISMRKLAEKEVEVEAPALTLQVSRWRYFVKIFLDGKKRFPDKYYILRYEDHVTDQEKIFRELCEFLGIAYDPSVFDFYKKKEETLKTYGNNVVWGKFHENLLKPINTGRMNTWQNDLTPQQVMVADQIAGKYADRLGYERKDKRFHMGLFLRSLPMEAYNYILFKMMIFGTYLPYKLSRWWFQKSLFLLKIYMYFFGKKKQLKKENIPA